MPQIKNIVIGIAIIILTIFVVIYGISTIYPGPEYNKICPDYSTIDTQTECEAQGGAWIAGGKEIPVEEPMPVYGSCDIMTKCSEDFEKQNEKYARTLFLITLPLGIVILVIGAVLFGLEAVGAGLMGGGVGVIIYGAGSYWRYSGALLKFLLSLVGLIAVIYLAYWFNKKKH